MEQFDLTAMKHTDQDGDIVKSRYARRPLNNRTSLAPTDTEQSNTNTGIGIVVMQSKGGCNRSSCLPRISTS